MRAVVWCLLIACGGTTTAVDGGGDAAADVKPGDAAVDVADGDAAIATVSFSGTTVVSPSGTELSQVAVCVYDHTDLPCATSDASGAFTIGLPMDSDTGVLLTRAGYTSVLLPLTIAEQAVSGYEIGIPTAQSRTTLYAAFGATFPDTVNGFIMLDGTLQGQNDIGLAGASGSLTPQSGTGPFYLDMNGDPAPAATSTSTYSLILFAGVAPSTTYVGSLTPITMSCYEGFGGWSVAQIDATRFPVVAGFETHVGLTCHN